MSNFDDLIELIGLARDKGLLADLLLGLTTSKERDEFVQRIEIVKKLVQGEPQAKIAKDLGVGVATVTRGSKELAQGRFKILRERT